MAAHLARNGSSSNFSSASSSTASSSSSRRFSSTRIETTFPETEPEDYCRPQFSVETKLSKGQRLAVLIDRNLWKSDSDASECDSLGCETRFTLKTRRHHCRKCGGVFCSECSDNTIELLDTSRMPFVVPPSNLPLPLLKAASPTGTLIPSRVCKDCYAMLTGQPLPSTLRVREASATALPTIPQTRAKRTATPSASRQNTPVLAPSPASGSTHSASASVPVYYPPGTTFVAKPRHLRRSNTGSSSSSSHKVRRDSLNTARSASPCVAINAQHRASPIPQPPTPLGGPSTAAPQQGIPPELQEYPLKVSSRECKQSGAAFWVPKPQPRRLDSPIRYETACARRQPEAAPKDDDSDEEEDDEGAPPVVPVRRTPGRSVFQTSAERAAFASPSILRDKNHVSNF